MKKMPCVNPKRSHTNYSGARFSTACPEVGGWGGGGWGVGTHSPRAAICAGAPALRRPGYEICWTFTAFIFTTIRPVQQKKKQKKNGESTI